MSSLPRYRSHKEVNAFKIRRIEGRVLYPEDEALEPIEASDAYFEKHKPVAGGYYVVYPGSDNYASWSPAEAFEEGYTLIEDISASGPPGMCFGGALNHLKSGDLVTRAGWNGKDMFLYWVDGSTFEVNRAPLNRIFPEGTTINYHSHIDMKTVDGTCVPWLASQTDIAAEDWFVVESPDF